MLTGCKESVPKFLTSVTHTHDIGSDGCIARWSTFGVATQDVSGMRCRNYQRRSMRHTSGHCERSTKQIGSLPTDCFNVSLWHPGRFALKNLRSSLHSILTQDRLQSSRRDGAWKIRWTRCFLHVPHCWPSSTSVV